MGHGQAAGCLENPFPQRRVCVIPYKSELLIGMVSGWPRGTYRLLLPVRLA